MNRREMISALGGAAAWLARARRRPLSAAVLRDLSDHERAAHPRPVRELYDRLMR